MRVHIPVVTNEGVDFRLRCPAAVPNDRVRVVIDTVVNDWVAALFQRRPRRPGRLTCPPAPGNRTPYMRKSAIGRAVRPLLMDS